MKRSLAAHLDAISIDPELPEPLYRQLYFAVRDAILSGRLRPGSQSRTNNPFIATDLGLSRNTVVSAFDQLLAEGYTEVGPAPEPTSRPRTLPEELLNARGMSTRPRQRAPSARSLETRCSLSSISGRGSTQPRAFSPGIRNSRSFHSRTGPKLLGRKWRRPPRSFLSAAIRPDYAPLREAVATHLGASRAVQCSPDQIIIVFGAQQAIDLTARVLIDPGDSVWMEEPGFQGMRGALLAAGAELAAIAIDEEGMNVIEGRRVAPGAVSPAFPHLINIRLA